MAASHGGGGRHQASYLAAGLGLASDQLHEAVVLLVLVGKVADLADLLLPLAALLVLQPPLLLLALLLQLPRAQLLLAGRLLGRRTWEGGAVVSCVVCGHTQCRKSTKWGSLIDGKSDFDRIRSN